MNETVSIMLGSNIFLPIFLHFLHIFVVFLRQALRKQFCYYLLVKILISLHVVLHMKVYKIISKDTIKKI